MSKAAALRAMLAEETEGKKPTKSQLQSIQRLRRQMIADGLPDYLSQLTQADYLRLAGITEKTLDSHYRRLGLTKRRKVDLKEILSALHAWFSKEGTEHGGGRGKKVQSEQDIAELTDAEIAKLDLRDQKIAYEVQNLRLKRAASELDLEKAHGHLIDRDTWRLRIEWMSQRLASVGNQLGKKIGPEAQRVFNELLEGMEADLLDEKAKADDAK